MSELRWNPLLAQWLVTRSAHRDRSFMPTEHGCPLCAPLSEHDRSEILATTFDVAVIESRVPTFGAAPAQPSVDGSPLLPVRPAVGASEILLYTTNHDSTLATEPVERIYQVVRVWTDRFESLGAIDAVKYVLLLENQREKLANLVTHPHGQIYGYPFVPPIAAREIESSRLYEERTGRCLLCDVVAEERADGRRVLTENATFVATVPFFARYPYEVQITPLRHLQALNDMLDDEHRDLAEILKAVLVAYEGLFEQSIPYVLSVHQRPTDGQRYDAFHFHVELYPSFRRADHRLDLAGGELAAGVFVNDTLPEANAAELREQIGPVEWRIGGRRRG